MISYLISLLKINEIKYCLFKSFRTFVVHYLIITTMKKFTITNGQSFTNAEGEVLTIKQVTKEVYPIKLVNGAYVDVDGYKSHMNMSAIENFKLN